MVHLKSSAAGFAHDSAPEFISFTGAIFIDHLVDNSHIFGENHIFSVLIPNGPTFCVFENDDDDYYKVCISNKAIYNGIQLVPEPFHGYGYTTNNQFKEFKTYGDVLIELWRLIKLIEFN